MKLPNGDRAIVEIKKLTNYCLSTVHPRGRHKARVFAAVGIREEHSEQLREAILRAAIEVPALLGAPSEFGKRYTVDFEWKTEDRAVGIRTTWIVRNNEELPRLTSCYVL